MVTATDGGKVNPRCHNMISYCPYGKCYSWKNGAYVDDNSLAEVMIMRYWMEVMLTRVLRILMDPLLFIPRDFRQ